MEETIELRELFEIILKRKWLIIVITIIALIIGSVYSIYMVTPMYKSDTTLMVNGSKGLSASDIAASFDLGSINLSQKLVVTYGEIVKSRIVMEQVIERLELNLSYAELMRKTTSQQVGSTEILRISVEDQNPEQAALIANTISDVFVKEVMRILKVNNVETIDVAIPSENPFNIKTTLNIAIATVLGVMLSVFLSFLMEYMDQTIKTEKDVEKHLGLPVVGVIPDFAQAAKL
ncbi:MAG: Wzz/FepE/Etk N-terminal domain-containing protein [Bacillota bacterium]|nr:Wzz/FepE/Etk N-terminal domain-containing protein [Bacillota bacterium]